MAKRTHFGGGLRRLWRAVRRGFVRCCPACGGGRMFSGYVRVMERCRECGQELAVFRSDDAPPYFTILVVGHVVLPGILLAERLAAPALWLQMAVWLPLTLGLTLALLPRVKGAIIALHWGLDLRAQAPAPQPCAPMAPGRAPATDPARRHRGEMA